MGSDCNRIFKLVRILISIHAPRMGSDNSWSPTFHPIGNFNPRSPDGERRRRWLRLPRFSWYFNPRSPDGERRAHAPPTPPKPANFNPRSPDGERQSGLLVLGLAVDISIHAPRMGSDLDRTTAKASRLLFQSTLPGWGATVVGTKYWISAYVFQSTLPGWGATKSAWYLAKA